MVKFYKPGKIVVILNGRYAGRKGVIVKSNYESVKGRKYPHCMVVGLSKGPKKPTKKNIAKMQAQIKQLESSNKEDSADRVKRLKSFGIFIKTYNMSHLLATRYTLKDELGIAKSVGKIDELDKKLKEDKAAIENKEKSRKDDKDLEALKSRFGQEKDDFKNEVRNAKVNIGTEMYKRFMKGFVSGKSEEEKENQTNTQFLFKKLQF